MQRIEIHNFGPIKDATIEIPKFLLLIGEQASGKSTVAKLIYFFHSLKEGFTLRIYKHSTEKYRWENDFAIPTGQQFLHLFGYPRNEKFEIIFHYTTHNYVSIKWVNEKLTVDMSNAFKTALKGAVYRSFIHSNRKKDLKGKQIFDPNNVDTDKFSKALQECFGTSCKDSFYLIAERSSMVRFGNLFERLFSRELDSYIQKLSTTQNQTIEEILLMTFLDRIALLKDYFSFANREYLKNDDIRANWMVNCMYSILKGKYSYESEERISWGNDTKSSVLLRNASSGQQEVIRILQDCIWIVEQKINAFRVLEEPESHLFPLAQKKLLEFLSAMVNASKNNKLGITTHSPYILSSANNLLFASHVASKFPDLAEVIQSRIKNMSWINPSEFRAYALDQNQEIYCKSIVDERTGMIAQNYLDSVSDELSSEFNQIYKLYISKIKEAK